MLRSPEEARRLVVDVLGAHADSLLRVARRHSVCLDDAHDAYQRAVEIFLRHAATLEVAEAHRWLHTVVKHEAMAVRRARLRVVADEEPDLDAHEARDVVSPEDRAARFERMARSAEALQRLKPQELRALWLCAQGHSYAEIAELTSWSFTKVNRLITEGRRRYRHRLEGIETGAECRRWEPVLSALVDGEATAAELAQARPHLRNCASCRATVRTLREANAGLAALAPVSPVPVAAGGAAGLLARLHDAIAGGVQDRIVASALKLQSGLEAFGAAKVAAVAASAAAIAGGGVAVEQAASSRPAHHASQDAGAAHPPAAHAAAAVAATGAPPRPLPQPRARPAPRRVRAAEFRVRPAPRAHAAAASSAAREFTPPAVTAVAASAAPRTAADRTRAAEFGVG